MKLIKEHRQETIAVLIIAIFWIGVGIKDQMGYTPLTPEQFSQQVQEETSQTPAPSDTPDTLPAS